MGISARLGKHQDEFISVYGSYQRTFTDYRVFWTVYNFNHQDELVFKIYFDI